MFLFFFVFIFFVPFQEHFILFPGDSHKATMLRSRNTLDIYRIGEIAEILISLADTVMLRMITILDISHTPGIITDKLESRTSLSQFTTLETYEVIIDRSTPTMSEILAGSGEDTSLSALFLDKHVVETIALQEVDIGIMVA